MRKCVLFFSLCALFTVVDNLPGQGTAFTYQGRLQNSGSPASGNYDFTFALFNNSSTNTGQVGGPLTSLDVPVSNGLFTVTMDFGSVFNGSPVWLAIATRTNGGAAFTPLSPLQELTPVPYAIYAANSGMASTFTGPVTLTQLPAALLTNNAANVTLSGSFAGDGSQLTGLTGASFDTSPSIVESNVYSSSGTNVVTVPAGASNVVAKLWGAGGGNLSYLDGGGGAFAQVTLAVSPGQTLVVVVGQNGNAGGAAGANDASGGSGSASGGWGGQGSSLFTYNNAYYIMKAVAGGGGGPGGGFGGNAGQAGTPNSYNPNGATAYATGATTVGVTDLDLIGGVGSAELIRGDGGGGFGGGGNEQDGQADGGGSYGDITMAGSLNVPGNTSDPAYEAGAAYGGADGLVVLVFQKTNIIQFPYPILAPSIQSPLITATSIQATTIQAASFSGNGSQLTNLNASQLAGTIRQSNLGPSGSYTPTVGNGTANFATTTQSGYYAKMGNLVYFETWLLWTSKGSATTGNLAISLPFTNNSSRAVFSLGYVNGVTSSTQLVPIAGNNATSVSLYSLSTIGGPSTIVPITSCLSSGEIQITGWYRWQ